MSKDDNKKLLRTRVIRSAENNDIFLRYTTLNDDFTKRMKDENRYQNNKELGDKRLILESPTPPERKPWLVEDDDGSLSKDDGQEGIKEVEKKKIPKEDNESLPNSTPTKKKKKNKKNKK
ncbi:hypothetical protein RhiirC2_775259 [Rhizophagus irregularis]|uniref:Uncharacterized protein n=1 Tax=Rhizophagus irregularis TaxID=588596 RepID=A0A2N1NJS7_9GLOM|nr:hypothetical protein RhiirC2_775259 [Rhizophagus irregularis]